MSNTKQKFKKLLIDYEKLIKNNENNPKDVPYLFLELVSNTGSIIEIINYKEYCKKDIIELIQNSFYCLAHIAYKLDFHISEVMNILDPISVNTTLRSIENNITYMNFINGKIGEEIKKFCFHDGDCHEKLTIKNRIMEIIVVLRNLCNLLNINMDDILVNS